MQSEQTAYQPAPNYATQAVKRQHTHTDVYLPALNYETQAVKRQHTPTDMY